MALDRSTVVHPKKTLEAAVRAADGQIPDPPELLIASYVERYGAEAVLGPGPIALDKLVMTTALMDAYHFVQQMQGIRGDENWAKLSQEDRDRYALYSKWGWLT